MALFAVGSKTRQGFTRENKSVLAIFEFLAKQEPPPGTFQAAIDCLAGARSKKLDGMRRVLGIHVGIVIETDRDQAAAPRRACAGAQGGACGGARDGRGDGLAQQVVSILGVLEKNSKHAQASTAGRSNWSGW